jgi:hypothetical protein
MTITEKLQAIRSAINDGWQPHIQLECSSWDIELPVDYVYAQLTRRHTQ